MQRELTDRTDIKIFILYLLKHIEKPIDFVTLNDIVVQDEIINQFDFAEGFYELCEMGAVEKCGDDGAGHELFRITDSGSVAAETLESGILRQIREKSVRSAIRLLSFRRRGAKTECIINEENGRFRLIARATEEGTVFFESSLLLDTRHQAELMQKNYESSPELLYRGVLGILSGDLNYLADAFSDDGDEDGKENDENANGENKKAETDNGTKG